MADPILPSNNGDQEAYLSSNIEDYLLSLADSLQQVQRELNRTTIAGAEGTPSVRYQLPKLEFELKMSIEMGASQTNSNKGVLKARPINALNSSSSNSAAEAASTIKGTFVAVPVDGGKPPVVLLTRVEQGKDADDPNRSYHPNLWTIYVEVQSAVGQRLEGVEVQFNIDRAESFRLSTEDGIPNELSRETDIRKGLVSTNQYGIAENVLEARPTEETGAYIVLLIDVLGRSESLIFKVGEQAFTPVKESLPIITQLNQWLPDDATLFGITSKEAMVSAFTETLSEALRQALEDNEELQGQLDREFDEKYEDIQLSQLNALSVEFANWLTDFTIVFSDNSSMRAAFEASINPNDDIALLAKRNAVWNETRMVSSLQNRFDKHRQEQKAEVLEAFNAWTPAEEEAFANETAMQDAFLASLVDGSDVQVIGAAAGIWEEADLQTALSERFASYVKTWRDQLIDAIDDWPIKPGSEQLKAITDLATIQAVFYARGANAVKAVNALPDELLADLKADEEVIAAFEQKLNDILS